MPNETIIAVFDNAEHANAAANSLKSAGVPDAAIRMHANTADRAGNAPQREEGFWSSLFGGAPDQDVAVYERSLAGGSTVLSIDSPEEHVSKVIEILESHNPVDIDERATSYGLTQNTAQNQTASPTSQPPANQRGVSAETPKNTDGGKMQLSEEELAVGKRVINRGGTRIRRFVVETPVEESVSLHSEKVVLERNPVSDGRAPTDSFSEKTIEMTEMAEEAVVSKSAHVYEEVGLRKEATDRVETVRDNLRKEEVEVVQVPGAQKTSAVEPVTTKTVTTDGKPAPKV